MILTRTAAGLRNAKAKFRNLAKRALLIVVALLAFGVPAGAQDEVQDEHPAIHDLLDKFFAAVESNDPDDWRAIVSDEARNISFRPDPDGPPGALSMREEAEADSIARLTPDDPRN